MARGDTKKLLLQVGMRIFTERGYSNAGIEAIIQAAKVPKGSFYNYFQSKEDFGIQVINQFAENTNAHMDEYFNDISAAALERFRHYYEAKIATLETEGCKNGCLVGRLSQEMADQSENFRSRLQEVFQVWIDRFAACLAEAQVNGAIPDHLDPQSLAEFWLISWQGAALRAKTIRELSPMKLVLDTFFNLVLQSAAVASARV